MPDHPIAWFVFGSIVLAMLALDLGVFHRKPREERLKEALIWCVVWIGLALAFNAGVYYWHGGEKALQFFTGYVVEFSLSVDNLFVFLLVFSYFKVSRLHRHKILFWGILGALLMRAMFIAAGITLLETFHWIIYAFGALLVASGIKMAWQKDKEVHPERNPILKLFRRLVPVAADYDGSRFLVWRQGRLFATPLLVVLLIVESTDLVFGVDSVPAVLAITPDPFIVYTSNVFAILGLRSLFFVLEGIMSRFHYLHYGLSAVLVFVGLKMLLSRFYPIPTWVSLACILGILTATLIASWLWKRTDNKSEGNLGKAFNSPKAMSPKLAGGRSRGMAVALISLFVPLAAAAGSRSPDASNGSATLGSRHAAIHAFVDRDRSDSAKNIHSPNLLVRPSTRRAGTPGGVNDGSLPAPGLTAVSMDCETASRLFTVNESPADVLRGWQFNLRAASEPRAPSLLR